MSEDDGGPAFPVHEQWNEWSDLKAEYVPKTGPRGGMSLLDYFAGQALAALLADPEYDAASQPDVVARDSYQFADAMIAQRKGRS